MADQLSIRIAKQPIECPFCTVIAESEQTAIVHQTTHTAAFIDRRPLFYGHTLVVPKQHVETLHDLPVEDIPELFSAVRLVMMAVEQAMEAQGTFIAINNRISQSVPHLHVHVVPRRRKDGLKGFFWPRLNYEDEGHLQRVRSSIRAAVQNVSSWEAAMVRSRAEPCSPANP